MATAGAPFVKVLWYYNPLPRALGFMRARLTEKIENNLERQAAILETRMKMNAPWRDQTGAARNGLRATVTKSDEGRLGILLYHSVEYGIFLETRWDGRYAIIQPTIERDAPEVMASFGGFMRHFGSAGDL